MSAGSTEQPEIVRRRMIYTGRVQGVGFRYTTRALAQDHPIVGFVRNLPDGTVELEAEGERDAVTAFLALVAKHFNAHIQQVAGCDLAPRAAEERFEISY